MLPFRGQRHCSGFIPSTATNFLMQHLAASKGHGTEGTILLWDGPVPPCPGQQAEGLTASPGTAPPGMERERHLLTALGFPYGRAVRRGTPGLRHCWCDGAETSGLWPGAGCSPRHSSPCVHTHTHARTHAQSSCLPRESAHCHGNGGDIRHC